MKIATWNVRGLAHKLDELEEILEEHKVEIAMITETKKKLKGSLELRKYTMIYAGVEQHHRASAGVAILMNDKWKDRIQYYKWVSERIIIIRYRIDRGYMSLVCTYAPEEGKREETQTYYQILQTELDKINKNDYIIMGGDLNARVGNRPIDNVMGTNGEMTLNNNGKHLIDFASYNNMRIMNTYYKHKMIHKITWTARGRSSIIDYFLANQKTATLVEDTRVFRSADISSDHYLLAAKIKLLTRWYKRKARVDRQMLKTYLLKEDSIKTLYQQRSQKYNKEITSNVGINEEWKNIKDIIMRAATETLGYRKQKLKSKKLTYWNQEIKEKITKKKQAYLKWIQNKTEENKTVYKHIAAEVKQLCKKTNQDSWDRFISNVENDIHGRQEFAYKMMKHLNKNEKDAAEINIINKEEWLKYYTKLWTKEEEEARQENRSGKDDDEEEDRSVDQIELRELDEVLQKIKNRKAPGQDTINAELLKFAPTEVKLRFLQLLNKCWRKKKIPDGWKVAKIKSIFKKGDRSKCENYRGISLLNTAYKVYSKIVTARLNKIVENILLEEQTGFRKGRSCTDNTFVIKQIIEKHREYNKETHILFIDYAKAFDKVEREKLWNILEKRGMPLHLIKVIKSMYNNSKITIADSEDRTAIINQGLRQGCSLSPTLFNIYIDDVLREWMANSNHYTLDLNRRKYLMTLLFADDQVLIASDEDTLQRAAYELNRLTEKYNLSISTEKTKVMAFRGSEITRSKIIINNKTIEQVRTFNFLGSTISYHRDDTDIHIKITKFNRINGTIARTLKNKVRKDTMVKFYKTMAIPCGIYGSESWTITRANERRIQTSEMRFLRRAAGYSRMDRKRNTEIREELGVESMNETIKEHRRNWKEHVERMEECRIPKRMWNYEARGRRTVGRPQKRWADQN